MKIGKKINYIGIVLFVLMLFNRQAIYASELSFNVEPMIPENQVDKTKTYFDLKTEPNMEETIKVNIYNNSDQDIVVEPVVKTATTNLNGVVEYGESLTTPNQSIPYQIENLVIPNEKEMTIPKKGSYEAQFVIKMPPKEFRGILAGGITLKEKETVQPTTETKGMAVENQYAYVVAVILHGNEEEVPKELNLTNVESGQVNYRNVINLALENPQSRYINQLSIQAEVTKKGRKKVLYNSKKEHMQMAPDSKFNYPISLDGKKLKAGNYTVKIKANSQDESWELTKDFKVSEKEAKRLNSKDVSIKKDQTKLYYFVGILLVFIVGFLFFFRYKSHKKKLKRKELEILSLKKQIEQKTNTNDDENQSNK